MKKTRRIIALLLAAAFTLTGCWLDPQHTGQNGNGITVLASQNMSEEYVQIEEGLSGEKIANARDAISMLDNLNDSLGVENAGKMFEPLREVEFNDLTYYRSSQMYGDIPVYGRNMVTVADRNGKALTLAGNFKPLRGVTSSPEIIPEQAELAASIFVQQEHDLISSIDANNQGLFIYSLNTEPVLCWLVKTVFVGEGYLSSENIFVNAHNGEIEATVSDIYYNQQIKRLKGQNGDWYNIPFVLDQLIGNVIFDEERNLSVYTFDHQDMAKSGFELGSARKVTIEDDNKSAADAAGNLIAAYDFFMNNLGLKQYDGNGSELSAYVNLVDSSRNTQAFFYKRNIYFTIPFKWLKEYSKNIDIVAHEFTHGVSETTASFIYSGQSGAIDEAISDIFGELVKKSITGKNDWIFQGGPRNMKNKKSMKDFLRLKENEKPNYIKNNNGYIHKNCLIIDHAAYLIGNGVLAAPYTKEQTRFINPNEPDEEGVQKMAKLWYGAMLMMTPDATFMQCARAVIKSAEFMKNTEQITQAQYMGVKEAFKAVGLSEGD